MKTILAGLLVLTMVLFTYMMIWPEPPAPTAFSKKTRAAARADKTAARSDQQVKVLKEQLKVTHQEAEQAKAALVKAETPQPGASFGVMMKQPGMKEFVKKQQKATLDKMMNDEYGELFAHLELSPETAGVVESTLRKRKEAEMDFGLDLMGSDGDPAAREAMLEKFKKERELITSELNEHLGSKGQEALRWYESTQPERATVRDYQNELNQNGGTLNDDQAQQLFELITAERKAMNVPINFFDQENVQPSQWQDEPLNSFYQQVESADRRVRDKARKMLQPSELKILEAVQKQQLDSRRTQIKMMKSLLHPQTAAR